MRSKSILKILMFAILITYNFCYSQELQERETLTDSFFKVGNTLSESGIEYELVYTPEFFSNVSGGINRATEYLDNFDFTLSFDLEKLIGWKGANSFFYLLGNNGDVPNDNAGTIQGISNIAAVNTWKVYEFWIEQKLFDQKLSLLAGLFDLNSEFDAREVSSIFINPTHGIGWDFAQSGVNGPSVFSTTSLAFRAKYSFSENISFGAAVLDGIPGDPGDPFGTHIILDSDDGLLIAAELAYETGDAENLDESFGKYAIGYWGYTSSFEKIDGSGDSKGNFGIYAFAEKFVMNEKRNSSQGLAVYARAGYANDEFNDVDYCASTGVVYYGLFNGSDDAAGFGIGFVHQNSKINNESGKYELNFEFTYSIDVFPWLNIQPDIQYIVNPNADDQVDNALSVGVRSSIKI